MYIVTQANATRRQFDTLTTSIYAAAHQIKLGSSVSSYIPTTQVVLPIPSITRATVMLQKDIGLSFLRVYGSRDFTVARVEQEVQGIQGIQGPMGSGENSGIGP
jgi:hypothetical protein